ncbi:MAG: hypothetical protein R3D68_13275 [Hyphomicrobiaceae bacterium]
MQYICDAPPFTWFRLETQAEAVAESRLMDHAVERYFRDSHEAAVATYVPPPSLHTFEQNIGLKDHVRRAMPMFVTLRANDGTALVTGMLPPAGKGADDFRPIIVGKGNGDPYVDYAAAIAALGHHLRLSLERDRCFPYRRG